MARTTVLRVVMVALLLVTEQALAQQAAIEVTPGAAAPAGSAVVVKWSGPNERGDYITVVRKGAGPSEYLDYRVTNDGRATATPVSIVMPAEPGAYEIRYVRNNPRSVLAAVPYEVTAISAAIEGPASVAPDSRFEVVWSGPNNGGDFVTIVAAGSAPRAYGSYVDARSGRADQKGRTVATLRAPVKSGQYELRYVQQGSRVIGTRAIEVTSSSSAGAAGAGVSGAKVGTGDAAAGAGPASGAGAASSATAGAASSGAIPGAGNSAGGAAPATTSGRGAAAGSAGAAASPAAGAPTIAAGGGAPAAGSAGTVSTGGGSTPTTRSMPSTTGRVLTEAMGAVNAWSGWARCQFTTSAGLYQDQQTQTWTISGAATMDGGRQLYPATWSVSGSGSSKKGVGAGPGSFVGGDWEHGIWQTAASGIAAPLALSVSNNRVMLSSAHTRLQSPVTIERYIGNETGDQMSSIRPPSLQGTVYELTLPVIDDVATSTRVSGSSSPVVASAVSPLQPADARTTASCTWLFEKGPTLSTLQPPAEPARARRTLPTNIVERFVASPIRVLTPNGSEDWVVNTRREVTWSHTLGTGQRFDIDISVDGGTTWLPLGRNVNDDGSGNRGAFTATMPAVGSTAGLVRVGPAGNASAGDISDSGFKLGPAWMRMLTPVSANVPRGGTYAMQIETNLGVNERYTIAVSYDSQRWETVTTSGYSGMSLSVPASAPLSQNGPGGVIRVTSNTVPTLSATGYIRVVP